MVTDASKSGVAHEAVQSVKRGMLLSEPEARQILGVTEKSSWDEVVKVCVFASHFTSHTGAMQILLLELTLYVMNAEIRQVVRK